MDRSESRSNSDHRFDDLVRILRVKHDRYRVETNKQWVEHGLALHHRQSRCRANVAQAQHPGSVRNDGHSATSPCVTVGESHIISNRRADTGHAGRVNIPHILKSADVDSGHGGNLPAFVLVEDLVEALHDFYPRYRRDCIVNGRYRFFVGSDHRHVADVVVRVVGDGFDVAHVGALLADDRQDAGQGAWFTLGPYPENLVTLDQSVSSIAPSAWQAASETWAQRGIGITELTMRWRARGGNKARAS